VAEYSLVTKISCAYLNLKKNLLIIAERNKHDKDQLSYGTSPSLAIR
jgi:hypothetical protein